MAVATFRIEYAPDQPPGFLARWISRIAVFSAVLLLVTAFLHRLFGLPTPVALHIAAGVFITAALLIAAAVVAGLDIWMTGRQGAARVVFGSLVALGLLALPAGLFLLSRDYPMLNDVTTDVDSPPEFDALVAERRPGSNPAQYQKDRFAALQAKSYPDVRTLNVPRPAEETFELVLQALGKLRFKIVTEAPPRQESGDPGFIEATDKTLVFGFVDDVAVRIMEDEDGKSSWVDVRSASRYGRSDFGRNAERVRAVLKEIGGRLEASIPGERPAKAPNATGKKSGKPAVKPQKARNPATAAKKKPQAPSQSGAQRAPAPKESLQE